MGSEHHFATDGNGILLVVQLATANVSDINQLCERVGAARQTRFDKKHADMEVPRPLRDGDRAAVSRRRSVITPPGVRRDLAT